MNILIESLHVGIQRITDGGERISYFRLHPLPISVIVLEGTTISFEVKSRDVVIGSVADRNAILRKLLTGT